MYGASLFFRHQHFVILDFRLGDMGFLLVYDIFTTSFLNLL